ncbi:DNA-processing protein DprA [Peptoniphilus equinus]|uniref:DNA-processing protein DprA n=1 Tax=Peptoniphilus equinus TaxID=3016343 RepID=A0ABY7QTM5_9FIRM|nr:DNA-processing protein DprA [Peptoniphilus equinus]WBW49711.1 DNA-processing protein DprA [Peptoniphilus equinus]
MDLRDFYLYTNSLQIEAEQVQSILAHIPSVDVLFEADLSPLAPSVRAKLKTYQPEVLERLKATLERERITALTLADAAYPMALRTIENPPAALYVRGDLSLEFTCGVGIVGSRKATAYGHSVVNYIVDGLQAADVTVISGMAYGIDALAHTRALENDLPTIAVLGSGVDVIYPKANRQLYENLVVRGAVISEYAPGTPPNSFRFPRRNRIISGLSRAIVVVEAMEKSGSLITARLGAEQGREVFAVPGAINNPASFGTNRLIRDGALILSDVEDLLSVLPKRRKVEAASVELSEDEQTVVDAIAGGAASIEGLQRTLRMDIRALSGILTVLELKDILTVSGTELTLHRH